jgi:hypothetical protein
MTVASDMRIVIVMSNVQAPLEWQIDPRIACNAAAAAHGRTADVGAVLANPPRRR